MAAKKLDEFTGIPELWMICREPMYSSVKRSIISEFPNPKKLYESIEEAQKDAAELCKIQNRRFYLLKVIDVVETTIPPVRWLSDE